MDLTSTTTSRFFRFCNRHPLVSPAYCRYPRFFGPPVPAAPSGAIKCPLRSAFSLDPSSTCLPRVRKGDLCCGAGVRGGARGCAGVLGAGNALILLDFGCFRQRRRFSKNLAKKIEKSGEVPTRFIRKFPTHLGERYIWVVFVGSHPAVTKPTFGPRSTGKHHVGTSQPKN